MIHHCSNRAKIREGLLVWSNQVYYFGCIQSWTSSVDWWLGLTSLPPGRSTPPHLLRRSRKSRVHKPASPAARSRTDPHALRFFFLEASLPSEGSRLRRGERNLVLRRRRWPGGGLPRGGSGGGGYGWWGRAGKEEEAASHHHQSQEGLQGALFCFLSPRFPLFAVVSFCSGLFLP